MKSNIYISHKMLKTAYVTMNIHNKISNFKHKTQNQGIPRYK